MRKSLRFIVVVTLLTMFSIPLFSAPARETRMPTLVLDSRLWSPPEEQEFVINRNNIGHAKPLLARCHKKPLGRPLKIF